MKEIPLTQGKVAMVDDADYDWLNQWKWFAQKQGNTFYAARNIRNKSIAQTHIKMHRLILGLTNSKMLTDHKDRNGLNNTRDNLRVCSTSQNSCNIQSHKNSTSKYLGVCLAKYFIKSKHYEYWIARIKSNGKVKWLGYFKNEEEAALAYNKAATELHGEFANLNLIKLKSWQKVENQVAAERIQSPHQQD